MTARTYSSPAAFKQGLEQRLRAMWKTGPEFARRRQLLVFDRFLARAVTVLGDAMTLKGGLVLELRLERARTTQDVDLRLTGSPDDVLAKLQTAARLDRDGFLTFEIARDTDHPDIAGDGVQYARSSITSTRPMRNTAQRGSRRTRATRSSGARSGCVSSRRVERAPAPHAGLW